MFMEKHRSLMKLSYSFLPTVIFLWILSHSFQPEDSWYFGPGDSCVAGCPVHCRRVSSICGLRSTGGSTSKSHPFSNDQQKCLQTLWNILGWKLLLAENRRSRLKFIGRSSTWSSCICDLSVTYKHSEGYNGKVSHLPTLKQCQVWLMGQDVPWTPK